ncbi:MAG: cation:proton antiporter [Actinomycetia bacterium]|nr:cation:proton antiporter [Actinomycetes bacterium]MCH9801824.1 cation:proton antiporter [Actinomycetes bacterium]
MTSTTTEDILIGISLTVGIAMVCLLLAPRLRVPVLLLLLPAGFVAGAVFPRLNPTTMLGDSFFSLVNIAVGLILFHGGLELFASPIQGRDRGLIRRLVSLGALLTWFGTTVVVLLLLDVSAAMALLLGAILIVSGPTVVGPLLAYIRPARRVRHILMWEGTLIDPIGALIAVMVFQLVTAADEPTPMKIAGNFGTSIAVGIGGAVIGLLLMWVTLRLAGADSKLGTISLLGSVVLATGLSDAFVDDSGLLAAVLMGLAAPLLISRLRTQDLERITPFFDVVVTLSIATLFVAISALVTPASLTALILPCLVILLAIVLVIRPAVVLLLTWGSTLSLKERLFMGSIAPRGIVAAATAAGFSASLRDASNDSSTPDAEVLLPVTFLIIAGTVTVYSIGSGLMARLLGVAEPEPTDVDIATDLDIARDTQFVLPVESPTPSPPDDTT